MGAKRKVEEYPMTVVRGEGKVRICRRGNGLFKLTWREMGATRSTTKSDEGKAREWALRKASDLDGARGMRWVSAGDADALAALRRAAGTEEDEGAVRKLVADMIGAREWLQGAADLTTAARWYAENGPMRVERETVAAAVLRFLAEYRNGPGSTYQTFKTELEGFVAAHPGMVMSGVTAEVLQGWCHRGAVPKAGKVTREARVPAPRTVRNRITTFHTFLNRCRDWNLIAPGGKHAAALLRRPVIPDAGKEILSPEQGRALLKAVREKEPKLEVYLLLAGWLGLRPSECQRLVWERFAWEKGFLRVCVDTAQKTSMERWVPVEAGVLARLKVLFEASGKKAAARCCGWRSREFLSVLARAEGIVAVWPPDVLRHSFCSYRLAITQDIAKVAEEAGNSPGIIRTNYRRPVLPEEGEEWWTVIRAE